MNSKTIFLLAFLLLSLVSFSISLKLKKSKTKGTALAALYSLPPNSNWAAIYSDVTVTVGSTSGYPYNWYINLHQPNYSIYQNPSRVAWSASDSTLKTSFTKLRFDPTSLLVNTSDYTFATSTGQISHWPAYSKALPYGTACGCQAPGVADGSAVIDLRGTSFAVNDNFSYSGYLPAGNIAVSNNNQVININGGGYCGWTAPQKADSLGEQAIHAGGWHIQLILVNPNFTFSGGNTYLNLYNPNSSGYTLPSRKPWGSSDSSITTTWTKVRFDPVNLLINTGDYTFSSSVGQVNHWPTYNHQVPFGVAFGCQSPGTADGVAVIDLTGTGYAIDDTFGNGGYLPAGSAVFSNNGQTVKISGGGYCGWEGPIKSVNAGEEAMHKGGWYIKVKVLGK